MTRNTAPLRRTLMVVAILGAVVALAFAVELVRDGFVDAGQTFFITVPLSIVIAALAVGVLAARTDPSVGTLLVAGATGAAVGYWKFSDHPWPAAIGFAIAGATALCPLHAAVLHGGKPTRSLRRLLWSGEALVCLLTAAALITAANGVIDRWFVASETIWPHSVDNMLLITDARTFAHGTYAAWWITIVAVGAAAVAARWFSWRSEPAPARRRNAPVVFGAIGWVLLVGTAALTVFVPRTYGAQRDVADFGAIMLPAFALGIIAAVIGWVDIVSPQLGRVHAGRLDIRNIGPHDDASLRRVLADLLGTPRVGLFYANDTSWVDSRGRAVELADYPYITVVRVDDSPLAAIAHDPDVGVEAIDLAARVTAAQIEAQRATALARANTEAVRSATGRIVRAGDTAAEQVTSELLAGPIEELIELSASLRAGSTSMPEARARLQAATAQVREISHGLTVDNRADDAPHARVDGSGVSVR